LLDSIVLAIKSRKDRKSFADCAAGEIGCAHVYEEADIFRVVLLCEKLRPQMVVLDSELFGRELLSAAKCIRENSPDSITVLFGKLSDSDAADGSEFDAYVSKPLLPNRIMPTLVMAIAGRKKQQQLEERRKALETELKSSKVADFVRYKIRETNKLDDAGADEYLARLGQDTGKSTDELVKFIYHMYH
jgi:AmiR/NasT family two-component response regulator